MQPESRNTTEETKAQGKAQGKRRKQLESKQRQDETHVRRVKKNSRDGETKKAKQQGNKEDQLSKQRRKSLQLGHENHSDIDS